MFTVNSKEHDRPLILCRHPTATMARILLVVCTLLALSIVASTATVATRFATSARVLRALQNANAEHYVEAFTSNEIDYETFVCLRDQDLQAMGVGALGARRRLLKEIKHLQSLQDHPNPPWDPTRGGQSFPGTAASSDKEIQFLDVDGDHCLDVLMITDHPGTSPPSFVVNVFWCNKTQASDCVY